MRISDWSSDVCSSDLSPCGRDWHRPTESSTSSIIQNHPAAMGGRSLTGPPFFVAARKFVEVLQYGGKRILTLIPQTVKVSTTGFLGVDTFTVRSEEHTSELQSIMRISYAVLCLKKKTNILKIT